jgi:hypothetical protein
MPSPSIFSASQTVSGAPDSRTRLSLDQIRQKMHQTLHDCSASVGAQRMIFKINLAQTPAELWQLRSDLHLCISRLHGQTEAARRINALLADFSGWIPPTQLVRI